MEILDFWKTAVAENPGVFVAIRVGDYFEWYGEQAEEIAKALNITLTKSGDVPMCGVPYHSVERYLVELQRLGMRVALCEPKEEACS